MTLIFIFLYFIYCSLVIISHCDSEYIPALLWASQRFQIERDIEALFPNKVKSKQFSSHLTEILKEEKPLIVVFSEYDLSHEDFELRDENGFPSFPFLNNMTLNSKVDYFRNVESPQPTLIQLCEKNYTVKYLKPGQRIDDSKGVLLLVEFRRIRSERVEILKSHDEVMEGINDQLDNSQKDWICVYTARHPVKRESPKGFEQLSPWHLDTHVMEKSSKVLFLYEDVSTGFTLVTRGSIQLVLPSPKNFSFKSLENYLGASAKTYKNKIDFIIRFSNYTLTFNMNLKKKDWLIDRVKISNDNEDSLDLFQSPEKCYPENKCHVHTLDFQSRGNPVVKIKLLKYKFLHLQYAEEPCEKPYKWEMVASFVCTSILTFIFLWNAFLKKIDFTPKPNVLRIPSYKIYK